MPPRCEFPLLYRRHVAGNATDAAYSHQKIVHPINPPLDANPFRACDPAALAGHLGKHGCLSSRALVLCGVSKSTFGVHVRRSKRMTFLLTYPYHLAYTQQISPAGNQPHQSANELLKFNV